MALAIQGHYPADIVRRAFFNLSFHEHENGDDNNTDSDKRKQSSSTGINSNSNNNNTHNLNDVNEHGNREQAHSPFLLQEAATRRVVSSADESDMVNHSACGRT